jgi:hypothetical protein
MPTTIKTLLAFNIMILSPLIELLLRGSRLWAIVGSRVWEVFIATQTSCKKMYSEAGADGAISLLARRK